MNTDLAIMITRIIYLISALIAIIVWARWGLYNKGKLAYSIPPLSWAINVAAFSLLRLIEFPISPSLFTFWSAVLNLHAMFLLIGAGVILSGKRGTVYGDSGNSPH